MCGGGVTAAAAQPYMLEAIRNIWQRELNDFRSSVRRRAGRASFAPPMMLLALPQVHHRDVPVLLVGNHAERRQDMRRQDLSAGAALVQPADAIELARSCEMLKYIEVRAAAPASRHRPIETTSQDDQ
jgi:hypothetical protein